ncbi:rod shape-determining protein [Megalodesulfovibrio gigas]|uniref:Cell shape-determining protein MreB n=1 Tax=Megalodesulfovibrio gigas (strain ATCC 19364 / DSM 1382 / NCIMB 9332 / VKM B-1759) TaxID=1121448 RepID=T2GCV5_MEGG1|nr:rod shape-determining protein [Megalodesulfovibrio gigas]AGW14009.1 putative rod shape-determining protein MreB [Megalodesulfovibrio gigas DSM 1382 = ATCC 19364]
MFLISDAAQARKAARQAPGADVGVDFGTGHVVIWKRGQGLVLHAPSIIALNCKAQHRVLAVGDQAKRYAGRTPRGIRVISPMQGGMVADLDMAETLLKTLLQSCHGPGRRRRLAIAIPLDATDVERNALLGLAGELGYAAVQGLPSPLAAALGAGLPVLEPRASMVLDLGSGCCEAAIVAMGGIVTSRTLRSGGNELDAAVQQQIRLQHHLHAGQEACEALRQDLGSLDPAHDTRRLPIKGLDTRKGLPCAMEIEAAELRPILTRFALAVADTARSVLERCPPELSGDLLESGITLCGGLALQHGLAAFLQQELRLPVFQDAAPLTTVARGLGAAF